MKEKYKLWGLYGKIYLCLIVLLWCVIWLLRMEYRFGLEPFYASYTESKCFAEHIQRDMNTLTDLMEECLYERNEDSIAYLQSNWMSSNFKFTITGRDRSDNSAVYISNTKRPTSSTAVSSRWQFYYSYQKNMDPSTNAYYPIQENWITLRSRWLDINSIWVYIEEFSSLDEYRQEYLSYQNYSGGCQFVLVLFFLSLAALISIDISWQCKNRKPRPWDRLYVEELFCLLVLSISVLVYLTQGCSWLDVTIILGLCPLPVSCILFSIMRQWLYSRIHYSNSCFLITRYRLDWSAQKSFLSWMLAAFGATAAASFFLFNGLGWPLPLYSCFLLLMLQIFLYGLRFHLDHTRLMHQITSMSQGETFKTTSYRTLHYQKISALLAPLANQIQELITEALKAEHLKVDLITNVSHDLKTPLTSIITYIRLLEKEKHLSPKSAEYLQILSDKSLRLKSLTEDLLEAARITSGNETISPQQLNFAEMVLQANGEFAQMMDDQQLELISNLPSASIPAWIDSSKTWRILSNLYGNVCKHALPGTRVYVDVGTEDDCVWLCMKNTSRLPLNIPAEELMERFVQGDASRSSGGNGLGLTIARELARLQNGSLDLTIYGDLFMVRLELPRKAVQKA